jgi:hypothetical protein
MRQTGPLQQTGIVSTVCRITRRETHVVITRKRVNTNLHLHPATRVHAADGMSTQRTAATNAGTWADGTSGDPENESRDPFLN